MKAKEPTIRSIHTRMHTYIRICMHASKIIIVILIPSGVCKRYLKIVLISNYLLDI